MEEDDELLRWLIEMEAEDEGIECNEEYILQEIDRKRRPYIIEKDGKYSLSLEKEGTPIQDVWYDEIKKIENSLTELKYYSVTKNDKVGIIDSNMKTIVDCVLGFYDTYELLFSSEDDFEEIYDKYQWKIVPKKIYHLKSILVKKRNLLGVLRLDGTPVTPMLFDYVITRESHEAWMHEVLYEDIIAVLYINKGKDNQKVGFIVKAPGFTNIPDGYIKPIFDDWKKNCIMFDDSHLEVILNGKTGYLDEGGNFTDSIKQASIGMEQYWLWKHGFK